jgi:hypothetical protein
MDNPVGSLTKFQKSVILGSVLGDGYIRKFPGRKDALLEINHSYAQKKYVDWKYSILRNVVLSEPKMRKTNGKRIAYRFYTKQLPELTNLIQSFYPKGKKISQRVLNLIAYHYPYGLWMMGVVVEVLIIISTLNNIQFKIRRFF